MITLSVVSNTILARTLVGRVTVPYQRSSRRRSDASDRDGNAVRTRQTCTQSSPLKSFPGFNCQI